MSAAAHLEDLLGPVIAEAVLAAVREEIASDASRPAHNQGPRWLTLEQAAERLGCSPDAVRMRVKRGRLERRRQGRRVYLSAEEVDSLGVASNGNDCGRNSVPRHK